MARSSSDLPLPEAPRMQTHSPAAMSTSSGPTWRVRSWRRERADMTGSSRFRVGFSMRGVGVRRLLGGGGAAEAANKAFGYAPRLWSPRNPPVISATATGLGENV